MNSSTESVPVWVSVPGLSLSSIIVAAAGGLLIDKWSPYGAGHIVRLFQATVSTLAVAIFLHSLHNEENAAYEGKTADNRADYDGSQVAFDLTDMLARGWSKGGRREYRFIRSIILNSTSHNVVSAGSHRIRSGGG